VKKLYVGNLSFKATEEQVAALFSEIGVQPDSLTLLRDRFTGQPRGFGFAEIGNDAEAEKAVAALNGKDFLGRALVVNEARPQREGGGPGGGLVGFCGARRRSSGGSRSWSFRDSGVRLPGTERSQAASNSSRRLVIGQAPSELLEITVCVTFDFGSCTLRNETPASNPSRITVSLCLPSQKPRP